MENDMPIGTGETDHWHPHPTRPTRPMEPTKKAAEAIIGAVAASAVETSMTIAEHEKASKHRYSKLCHKLKKVKEEIMSTPDVNVYQKDPMSGIMPLMMGNMGGGVGAGAGAGLGAGLVGGLLGGLLFGGNRNLLGGGEGVRNDHVTPSLLASSLANVTESANNTAVLSQLGRIEAAIPYNEGQVQLALAGSTASLSNQASNYQISNIQGFANTNQAISTATAGIIAVGETVKDTVNSTAAATNLAVANLGTALVQNTYAIGQAINNDGDKTRALIQSYNDANLQRQLAVAEARGLEDRLIGRQREVEVNVTQNVNQNQAQAQAQQQQQQLVVGFNQLCAVVAGLQNAVATNSNMIIGNTGAVATGPQTANPVNVRT